MLRLAIALVLFSLPAVAVATPEVFTVSGPTAFSGGGFSGTVNPVSATDLAGFDFSGSGEISSATDGDHICNDGVGFFASCDYSGLAGDTTDEFVVYSVSLDGGSAPLDDFGPFTTGPSFANWSGYILDSDAATVTPTSGFVFSMPGALGSGRGHFFGSFSDPSSIHFLQPGETTAVLLMAFSEGLAADLTGGQLFSMMFGSPFDVPLTTVPLSLVLIPEPKVLALLLVGALSALVPGFARKT